MDNQNFIYYLIFGLFIIHKGNSKKILPRDNKLFFVRKETFGRKYILTSKQEWEKKWKIYQKHNDMKPVDNLILRLIMKAKSLQV